jgi:transcriptional regulator with XRE-family HTH domain
MVDDLRVGAAFRSVRIRRRWRQVDVADAAGVSRGFISLVERGHLDRVSLRTLRGVAAVLEIRIDVAARWRGGELDRLVNARHSALHESVSRFFEGLPDWVSLPEVSFAIYGERGVIDILAWHAPTRSLLVIELKTELVDMQEMVGTVDRKRRLAARVASERGWNPATVSCWIVVSNTRSNRRRVDVHQSMLRNAFPATGHRMRAWLAEPRGAISALSYWSDATAGSGSHERGSRKRVHRPATSQAAAPLSVSETQTAVPAGRKGSPAVAGRG